jgi:hypothetical protein
MKKQLLGTTTLVAAGLLTGQGAYAAEPMTASFSGVFATVAVIADRDDAATSAATVGLKPREYEIWESGEIQFSASGELDNGVSVGVRIEYEAGSGGAQIVDERYVTFSGGFGTLRIGSDDPAANAMHYQAPTGGTAWWIGVSSGSGAIISGRGATTQTTNSASSFVGIYPGISGDAQKIIYFTPRMSGFQLGVSYAPDDAASNGAQPSGVTANTPGNQSNEISAAVNYQGDFDAVSVRASAGFASATQESFVANGTDRDNYAVGLTVGFDAFAIGASYKHDDAGGINIDNDVFEAGASYSMGGLTWGLNYGYVEKETGANTEDDLEVIGVSFDYSMGPGVNFIGAVKHYDYGSDVATVATPDGIVMALGSVIYF